MIINLDTIILKQNIRKEAKKPNQNKPKQKKKKVLLLLVSTRL